MDCLSSNCSNKMCQKSSISDNYSDSESKSVSEIELRELTNPVKKVTGREKKCCKLKWLIPRRVLKLFGQDDDSSMTKIEKTIKASLLIQRWFRRYMARLEIRRRYTWTIFQTLEYAGEQDQVKLYNFFNALLTHIPQSERECDSAETFPCSSFDDMNLKFDDESPDEEYYEPEDKKNLSNFNIEYPYSEKDVIRLIEVFRKHRHFRIHPRIVADILKRSILLFKKLPNINSVSTTIPKQLTICGDLHGKFDDLLVIFHKNGLPSAENPYIFNGDFVDRGKRGLEVLLILLLCPLAMPGSMYLNRGNHEDIIMNQRYGFIRELQSKYKRNHEKLLKLIEGVYRYLPLGTIVNNRVLVVHGGISSDTDIDVIKRLERGKYASLLRPPLSDSSAPGAEIIDKVEWKQVFDILWSDPQDVKGCIPNTLRGAGTYFGPDVTNNFLERNRLHYIVRSHECKPDGYEICHNSKVITIFSASNYYEVGSNNGAYLKLIGEDLDTHFVQYMAVTGKRKLNLSQKMGLIEASAARELKMQIMNNRNKIEELFATADPENTGYISISEWCKSLENATNLQIPWRMLKEKLVTIDPETHKANYSTTFEIPSDQLNSVQGATTVVETLYRNKSSLEAIFHIIDKDNSGYISLEEFSEACSLIKKHMPCPMTHEQLEEICKLMDLNNDGLVDLNEFLESFRMVDPESKQRKFSQPGSSNVSPENLKTNTPNLPSTATISLKVQPVAEDCTSKMTEDNYLTNYVKDEKRTSCKPSSLGNENVIIHIRENDSNKSLRGNSDSYDNSLQMSPVLSSRRGSQI